MTKIFSYPNWELEEFAKILADSRTDTKEIVNELVTVVQTIDNTMETEAKMRDSYLEKDIQLDENLLANAATYTAAQAQLMSSIAICRYLKDIQLELARIRRKKR